jgi:hypothetical protein
MIKSFPAPCILTKEIFIKGLKTICHKKAKGGKQKGPPFGDP